MPRARPARAAALVLLAAACGGHKDAAPPAPAGSGSAPAVAPAPADAGASAVELVTAQVYRDAMKRGRLHTDKKRYAEAIAAFDAALAKKTNDPRALAERGYARLLAGDLGKASDDFDAAAKATKDPKLLSQIWYNRGLVDDKLKQPDNALVDFYLANKLAPTQALQSLLAGKTICPVRVDTTYERGPAIEWKKPVDAPSIEIEGEAGQGRTAYLVATRNGKPWALPIGQDVGGRCPGSVSFDVVQVAGNRVHVHGSELPEGGYDFGEDGPPGCAGGTPTEIDLVIDLEQGMPIIDVERPELDDKYTGGGRVIARLVATGLELKGLDCDRVVPL